VRHFLELLPPVAGLSFEEAGHRYFYNDPRFGRIKVSSVSQVLSQPAIAKDFGHWRRRLMTKGVHPHEQHIADTGPGQPLSAKAADMFMQRWRDHRAGIGSCLHSFAQDYLLKGLRPTSERTEAEQMYLAWEKSWASKVDVLYLSEQPMVHGQALYTGTPDFVGRLHGSSAVVLADWKTCQPGKARRKQEWLLQMAAYAELLRVCYGLTVDRAVNLAVWQGGTMEFSWNKADLWEGWRAFAALLISHHESQVELHRSAPSQCALDAFRPFV
jgi:hypothetical protein